jgi:formylmethanofuran:tetrahydromethanopterin formyltransferase
MSLLPILTATALATCPHLPAEAQATFVPERDVYAIYELIIDAYERRALAKALAPMMGQNVSTDDAECAFLPPEGDP